MRNIFVSIILLTLVSSCKKHHVKNNNTARKAPITVVTTPKKKRLGDFMDTEERFWLAKQSDTANYLVRVAFKKDFIVYQFHGQCLYYFFSNYYHHEKDQVELLWSYKSDCLLDMDFLKFTDDKMDHPKSGAAFCRYQLVNDSVVKAHYLFPQWARYVNARAKDSIFPTYLYLQEQEAR